MTRASALTSAVSRCLIFVLLAMGLACGSDGGTATVEVAGLRFILQPGTTSAGVPVTISVELVSDAGERLTSATNQVSLTATGATLGGTTTVAAVAGLATFTDITINSIGQGIQIVAHLGSKTATSATFNVIAGPASASQSTMTATPASPIANANASLTFAIKDAFGNPVVGATASFSANAAGVTFTPPTGTTDANGGVSTVFRSQNAGTVAITVNVGGINITLPSTITVAPGAASLRFVTQPATVSATQTFSVSVELLDNSGQRLTSATNQVALTLGAASLLGTTTVNAVAGLATFNGLSITTPVNGAVITATSGSLTVQSNAFNVLAGACASGTMTLGTPVNATVTASSGCTLNGHPAASFRFTAPAGNASVVTLGATGNGGLTPELAFTTDPAGNDIIFFVPTGVAPTREWLLAPGNYLASVAATTGVLGSFTINTTNTGAGAAGCTTRNLVNVSTTYAGQALAATDCRDPDPSGVWYEDRYLVYDSRPCVITLSAAFDTFMQLRETNLVVVDEDDDSGPGTDSQISRATCRSGSNPLMIAASSLPEVTSGAYTLTIAFTGAAPGESSQTITIAHPGASTLPAATMKEVFRRGVKR